MKRKLLWLMQLMIAVSIFMPVCHAQTSAPDSLNSKVKTGLIAYYKKYPQEKIFIHTSQNVYTGGQTISYALYATAYGKPSVLSKIVYVQLVNSAGMVITQNKLPLNNGFSNGNIDLPDSIKTGWYQLRGFTSWMMNFGEEGYFRQNIYIQNTADAIQKTKPSATSPKYHVEFYPEGGDMISGQLCNVAFKAIDDYGAPVDIEGQVIDDSKQTVAPLITTHDGMGVFRMDAEGGSYMAIINFPDKTVQKIALPPVKKEGIAMQANANSLTDVRIKMAYTGAPAKYKNVLLAAFQNNGNVVTYPLELKRGINQFEMKKSLFSTGILRLTIFDSNNLPLAERLVFIDNHDILKMQLKADTLAPSPRTKQVFELAPGSDLSKFAGGNLSVSVTDADAFEKDSTDNICSSLLLSPELRGAIHNPGWYFETDDNMHMLDLVMLTSGWRHFIWDGILNSSSAKLRYPVEGAQYIAGRIEDYHKPPASKLQEVIKLIVINQDSSKYIGYVTPDSTGSFILKDYIHNGVSTLYMETTDTKNKVLKLKIRLFNTLGDSLKNVSAIPLTISETANPPVTNYLLSRGIIEKQTLFQTSGIVLNTVHIKSEKENPTDKVIAEHVSPLYQSFIEHTLDLVNDPPPDISLLDYLRGRFTNLQIITDSNGVQFIYRGGNTLRGINTVSTPYIYLNETLTDFGAVEYMNLREIALIRFMPPPVAFAPYNGGNLGALMIYTKKPGDDMGAIESREKFDQYTFNGYTITREFSSPDYSSRKYDYIPDSRTTLYWNPHLTINNTGKVKIHFYNSDNAKHFRVIIQGMDADGHPGYLEEVF